MNELISCACIVACIASIIVAWGLALDICVSQYSSRQVGKRLAFFAALILLAIGLLQVSRWADHAILGSPEYKAMLQEQHQSLDLYLSGKPIARDSCWWLRDGVNCNRGRLMELRNVLKKHFPDMPEDEMGAANFIKNRVARELEQEMYVVREKHDKKDAHTSPAVPPAGF